MGVIDAAPRSRLARLVIPEDREARVALRLATIRVLVVSSAVLGLWYLTWRWTSSINFSAWWIAIPLVLAETYSLIDSWLFGITMWRLRERSAAPPPPEGATVDVFITTYNEPLDLILETAKAAKHIRWPHKTWVLDDGSRDEVRAACEAAGVGYVSRSPDWIGKPRHAKAGNLNNALFRTDGEFLLILDTDQVPDRDILHRTLGWFRDPEVALVQTPQWFVNVTDDDPLGSQAPLFYGPIQQGKDGWNAAFFCGSNAVLRREALMQLGVVGYVTELEDGIRTALDTADDVLQAGRQTARARGHRDVAASLEGVLDAVAVARMNLDDGAPISEVTYQFQRAVDRVSQLVVAVDVDAVRADLEALAELGLETDEVLPGVVVDDVALRVLSDRQWTPLGALEGVAALLRAIDVDRAEEAQPMMPLATISVTEDMATAMRLHAMGWRSVYHHEVLAHGLAPEDLGTMLQQRLRWAQGTLQVMLRENPLRVRGLSMGQKLMYLSTMWTYLSGFAAIVYVAAPVLYLCFGVKPVSSFGEDFLWHLLPYLAVNQLVFGIVGFGVRTWRGQQYSLTLFPLWIRACTTAIGNVVFGRSLGFVVTPKTRQSDGSLPWKLARPQLVCMGLLAGAIFVGLARLAAGSAPSAIGTWVNVTWALYDLVVFSVIIDAVLYRGPEEVTP